MTSTKGLEMLVRKNQPTQEEWFDLVEARRGLMQVHLGSFMTSALGSLQCLSSESVHLHELRIDNPELTGDKRFSLLTQGIFRMQPWDAVEKFGGTGYQAPPGCTSFPNGIVRAWGIERNFGFWLFVTVHFVGERRYQDRGYQRAKSVEIIVADLPTIVAQTREVPQKIWVELGKEIKNWAGRQQHLCDQAAGFARIVDIEEKVLSLVPK